MSGGNYRVETGSRVSTLIRLIESFIILFNIAPGSDPTSCYGTDISHDQRKEIGIS